MSDQPLAYRLVEISAAGTFGTVCVAQDLAKGKLVALKVLKAAHLHRPRVLARTRDEAALLTKLDHPNIVQIEGMVTLEDRPVMVLEWVRGLSMEQVVRANPEGMPTAEAIEIIRLAASALGAAYSTLDASGNPMHVIHRDIKPSNMLLSVDGEVKLVDFGIARGEFEGKEAQTLSMVLGARGYLAPERLDGDDDKPSCDVYSLGICLYEFLAGRHIVLSVHKDFHAEALQKHLDALQLADVPPEAQARIRKVLASMCDYHEHNRPEYAALLGELDGILADLQRKPDLKAYSRKHVLPLFRDRKRVRPIDHPAYPELAFVERNARGKEWPTPPDVDTELRKLLRDKGWYARRDEIDVLLVKNPHWSSAPFLEKLPSGNKAWWQFWGSNDLPADEIVFLLKRLQERPDAVVRERAAGLIQHSDPAVAQAAQMVLNAIA
jgi:serine/threonine protein kinase